MKKTLCVLLVICFAASILPISVLASSDTHDVTPPEISGVYMNSPGAVITVGDTLLFSALIEEGSDLYYPWTYLIFTTTCEQGYSHDVYAYSTEYDKTTGVVTFELEIYDSMISGSYSLDSVAVCDQYDNRSYCSATDPGNVDFQSLNFTIQNTNPTDIHDVTPPVINGVYMDIPVTSAVPDDTIQFTASIEEESDLYYPWTYLIFTTTCEQGYSHDVYAYSTEYDKTTGVVTFELEIDDSMISGTYSLSSIAVCDKYDNRAYCSDTDPGKVDFQSMGFSIQGTNPTDNHDVTPPEITGVNMDIPGAVTTVGDTLLFTASIKEDADLYYPWTYIVFTTICDQGYNHDVYAYSTNYEKDTGIVTFELSIQDTMINGTYSFDSIQVCDKYDNRTFLYEDQPGNIDFGSLYFTIATPDIIPTDVSIPSNITLPERSTYTIRPDVTPINSVPQWTWASQDTSICTVDPVDHGLNCLVTGIAPGTTTIIGTAQNDLIATCVVTVTSATLPESGIVAESYNVRRGGTVDIKPTLIPPDATSFFEVTSDNPHVASADLINSGTAVRIYGNNVGKATITIRGANGIVMTTTINVVGYPWEQPHEKVVEEGYDATCTSPGRTDAVRCSECYYYFVEPEEIPMKPHTYSEWEIIEEATPYSTGLRGHYCEVCGHYEEEEYSFTPEPTPRPSQPSTARPDPTTAPTPAPNPTTEPTPAPTATVEPTPEPTKPQVNVGDQNIEVTVDENTAAVTVAEKDLEAALGDAAEKGTLEVDVSSLKDVSNVTLPKNLVDAVVENEEIESLSLKTASGDITLNGDALKTVAGTVTGEHDEISLSVKTIDPDDIPSSQKYPIAPVLNRAVFIELSADVIHKDASGTVTGTDAIHEFNGDVTVSVPYEQPENMKGRQVIACYIADDGSITYFNVVYKDGIATFTTSHFSTFAIVESYAAVFEDIDISKWYMTSIEYALAHELMAGESDTIFAPDGMVSRAMAVQLLYNLSGKPETDVSATFADVDAGKWYAPAIAWAENKKVAAGYGNNQFGPDDSVTREQLATMLWQYAGRPETTGSIDSYEDAADVSSWAKKALCWAVENGIMQGSANHLNPKATASRAEAAALMANLHQMQNQNEST